jgi:hypothetical protein
MECGGGGGGGSSSIHGPPGIIQVLVVVVVVVEHFEDPRGLSDCFASAGFSTGNKEFPDSSAVSIIRSWRAL